MMKNEYDELHTLFGSKVKSVTVQAPAPVQQVQQVQPVQPIQHLQLIQMT